MFKSHVEPTCQFDLYKISGFPTKVPPENEATFDDGKFALSDLSPTDEPETVEARLRRPPLRDAQPAFFGALQVTPSHRNNSVQVLKIVREFRF